jgi:hypothetical protein
VTDAHPAPRLPRRFADLFGGAVIGLSVLLAVVMILHHPVAHGGGTAAILQSAQRQADIDHIVHGVLIALMGVLTLGFLHLTQRLGFQRPAAAAGFVAFAAGSLLVSIAGTFDGFVVPDVATWCNAPGHVCTGSGMLVLISAVIQDFTTVGFVAQSIGLIAWGIALLTARGGWAGRTLGVLGVLCGGASAAVLIGAHVFLTPHSLLMIFAVYGVWYLAAAAWLIAVPRTPD